MAVAPFFVLSGFVLARNYAQKEWNARNLKDYAVGRLARVYPVYALSIAVLIPIILADRTPGKGAYLWVYGTLLQGWLGPLPGNWNTPASALSWAGAPSFSPSSPARSTAPSLA
jgi:peptidoglycan/LPS O-acetylase OafA/YrhL